MKRIASGFAAIAFAAATVWLFAQIETPQRGPASLMPEGAMLYLEAKDFHTLLDDWNTSQTKRIWLAGDNYAAFSRSRLFQRLSQAQDEFSATATVATDANLLGTIAGKESALALYDIGNLQFVYVTRMDEPKVQATPLWLARDKFEQRTEGASRFYVRQDQQSNRTAAFAFDKGWLILGTRAGLVAGVLDRIDGTDTHGMHDEAWYADAVKQAGGAASELRMVLNLEKIVPSPYFRSYWVQRNITEMKQYRAAICDLQRSSHEYRESRTLLRAPGAAPRSSGEIAPLMALVPEDAVFSSAQASPTVEQVLDTMREDLLDPRATQAVAEPTAPAAPVAQNAGSVSDLETRIDVAPVIARQADGYAAIRSLLQSGGLSALLQVYRTRSSSKEMFVDIERGVVVESSIPWNEAALREAVSATLRRDVMASDLGTGWETHTGSVGVVAKLKGSMPLYVAVREKRLFLSTSDDLISALLRRGAKPAESREAAGTYEAVFQHSAAEQQTFRKLMTRLDVAGRGDASESTADDGTHEGKQPAFFSGDVASLSRMWANVTRETVVEKDQGESVIQTVVYAWKQK